MSEQFTIRDIFGKKRSLTDKGVSDNDYDISVVANKMVEGETIKQKLKTANSSTIKPTISLDEYCNIVYEWLRINPHCYTVLDFYEDNNNKPFLYPLGEVLKSEKIRVLLEQRMGRDSANGKLKGKSIEMLRNWYWGGDCFLKQNGDGSTTINGDIVFELG